MQIEVQTRLHEQLEDIQRIEAVSRPYDYVHTAVVEIREKLSIPEAQWPQAISELCTLNHIEEAAVLSTCTRSSGGGSIEKEKTLAMIKPDGLFGSYTNAIKEIILDSGFSICKEMTIHLDEDTVKSFYAEHSSKSFFPSLVNYMTSGPVLIMVLEKVNAVADWRAMIGPTDARKAKVTHPNSIRAMCGLDSQTNCVHGSDSSESAAREISFFFKEASSAVSKHDEL